MQPYPCFNHNTHTYVVNGICVFTMSREPLNKILPSIFTHYFSFQMPPERHRERVSLCVGGVLLRGHRPRPVVGRRAVPDVCHFAVSPHRVLPDSHSPAVSLCGLYHGMGRHCRHGRPRHPRGKGLKITH